MPSWKKLVVSGSDANLNSLSVTQNVTAAQFSGSFSGSFQGDGSQLTGIVAEAGDPFPYTGSAIITGSLQINDYTLPLVDAVYPNSVILSNGAGTLEFDIPKTIYEEVKNTSGVTLQKGTPVYVVDTIGNTNNVAPADATDPTKMPAMFILDQTLTDDQEGLGIVLGFINSIDTSGLVSGEVVYVGPGGGFTQTRPTGSALVQVLGIPVRIDPTNGSGIIFNAGTFNDLPNIQPGYFWLGDSNSVPTSASVDSLRSGSFSGSFIGNGSGLTGIIFDIGTAASLSTVFTSQTSVTVVHNLNTELPFVQVYDTNDELFIPLTVKVIDEDTIRVDFSETSSGKIVIAKGGHIVQGTLSNADALNGQSGSYYLDYNNFTNVPAGIVSSSIQLNNTTLTGMVVSGSFSGSFIGNGSGLTGIGGSGEFYSLTNTPFRSGSNTDVDTGTEAVITVSTGSFTSAFFDYAIISGSNSRAGTVVSVWNGGTIEYAETSTKSIGSTTVINLSVTLSSGNVVLNATTTTDNWTVKALARML